MTTHDLKVWPQFFDAVADGVKTFEVRRNDRGFERDDVLVLREWDPATKEYTGQERRALVTYIADLGPIGCPGFVAMQIRLLQASMEGWRF